MAPADPSHPAAADLARFIHGELKRPEARAIVRHMLTGCPQCVAVTRRLWSLGQRSLHLVEMLSAAGAGEGGAEGSRRKVKAI